MMGISFSALLWTFFYEAVAVVLALPVIIFALALAFYRPQGRPFPALLMAAINYIRDPKIYIWYRSPENFLVKREIKRENTKTAQAKTVSRNRLKELAWMLDTHSMIDDKF